MGATMAARAPPPGELGEGGRQIGGRATRRRPCPGSGRRRAPGSPRRFEGAAATRARHWRGTRARRDRPRRSTRIGRLWRGEDYRHPPARSASGKRARASSMVSTNASTSAGSSPPRRSAAQREARVRPPPPRARSRDRSRPTCGASGSEISVVTPSRTHLRDHLPRIWPPQAARHAHGDAPIVEPRRERRGPASRVVRHQRRAADALEAMGDLGGDRRRAWDGRDGCLARKAGMSSM